MRASLDPSIYALEPDQVSVASCLSDQPCQRRCQFAFASGLGYVHGAVTIAADVGMPAVNYEGNLSGLEARTESRAIPVGKPVVQYCRCQPIMLDQYQSVLECVGGCHRCSRGFQFLCNVESDEGLVLDHEDRRPTNSLCCISPIVRERRKRMRRAGLWAARALCGRSILGRAANAMINSGGEARRATAGSVLREL